MENHKNSEFVKEYYIEISTKHGEIMYYKVFSVYLTDSNSDYIRTKFSSQSEYEKFINIIKSKSILENKIEITKNDKY